MNILHEAPNSKEYVELRIVAGLRSKDDRVARTALSHSIFSVTARGDDSELIGMGRIIGDGGCYYQIVDLIVNPAYPDGELKGIIMNEILGYLDQQAPRDATVMVMADITNLALYQNHGFKLVYPELYGMSRMLQAT